MATTNSIKISHVLAISAITTITLGAVAVPVYKYWKAWQFNNLVERALVRFGSHEMTVDEVVEAATTEVVDEPQEDGVESSSRRVWKRISAREHTNLAQVVADEAYFQFGRRERSKANDLVVRKYIRDYLRDLKGPSLRQKDASIITELAVSLSYVPPEQFWEIRRAEQTRAYRSRVPTQGPQTV
jgi:hypothetical protein